ncbi:MAG: 16S rRNA (adenine(1518)-N(6)/adenine(1519)-N(6))-dimethyltransferase RsmA [Firmicutes bacterium]|nr:16S rRNA (adenine(1518)-N(6)/adenine(1519)-N(6))-dimethyltransferase RsmA [Bacillota bacterium]
MKTRINMGLIEKLKKNGFSFNKSLGQNFIVDEGFLTSVVSEIGLSKNDLVVEIGTGAGTLTRVLSNYVKQVHTFEVDKRLEPILALQFKDKNNINLVFKDALKYDFNDLVNENFKVVANIPYYITTPLLMKFILDENCKEICVLVQEELANRIVAKCGTKDFGALSVTMQTWGECKIIKHVSRNLFTPSPNVESAVAQIRRLGNVQITESFSNLVKGLFSFRRKTMLNALSQYLCLDKVAVAKILHSAQIPPDIRPEKVSVNKFNELENIIQKQTKID